MFLRPIFGYLVKLVRLFEVRNQKLALDVGRIVFIILASGISLFFFMKAVNGAKHKELWMDEINGLSSRSASYHDILVAGLASQVSKHPLDYVGQRLFDIVGKPLLSERMPKNVYFRLNSIIYNWFSGLLIIFVVYFRMKKDPSNYLVFLGQILCLLFALLIYYFWPYNFYHTIQMRPYALWNSLWLTVLGLFFVTKRFSWPLIVLLSLLAATAGAAFFQLCCLAVGFLVIRQIRKNDLKDTMVILVKAFSVPLMVSLYYILIDAGQRYVWYSDFDKYLKEFFQFWLDKEMVPILSAVGLLFTIQWEELRDYAVVFLTMLFLYLVSPFINYLVLVKGVFFSSRHYLYYDLIYPLFFINMALILPFYWNRIQELFREDRS